MKPGKPGGARASRIGALGFTLLALMLTALTAFLLAQMIGGSEYANEPVKDVVVAAKTIQAAERINEDHLKVVKWPASTVPDGAFHTVDDFLGPNPRVTATAILEGEPILKERLASSEAGTGMASLVPPNSRAFPIPVDSWIAEARLVYPGAVVDVLSTIRNTAERKVSTKMVLQNIRVLAVNGAVDVVGANADEDKKKRDSDRAVVTLLVTPEQAEALALASREGKIDLMLRNAQDQSMVETLGISPPELLGNADPEELEAILAAQKAAAELREERKKLTRRRRARRRRPEPKKEDQNFPPDDRPATLGGSGRSKTIRLGVK